MNLAVYEWRKLFRLPALWAFLALCLAFNGLLIATLSPYDLSLIHILYEDGQHLAATLRQQMRKRFDAQMGASLDAISCAKECDIHL